MFSKSNIYSIPELDNSKTSQSFNSPKGLQLKNRIRASLSSPLDFRANSPGSDTFEPIKMKKMQIKLDQLKRIEK